MSAAFRMIDANLNRAREAIRTIEDVARFGWSDGALAAEAKALRHALAAAVAALPADRLAAARDVAGDPGTAIEGAGEYARDGLDAVAVAAGKRLGEALRAVEEAVKTLGGGHGGAGVARAVEAVRYRAYALEAKVALRAALGAPRQWRLCVLLTRGLCRRPWEEVVAGAIAGGADAVQVREKSRDGREIEARELVEHARAVRAICAPRGVATIVNDRLDVALAAGAEGVHLGTGDLPVAEARRIAGASLRIGASTHSLAEARAAIAAGADHCGVGAMYESGLKPGLVPSGEAYLRAFLGEFPQVPHLAIGGISPGRVAALARAGCRGVAVSSAICGADDPEAVARAIVRELELAREHAFEHAPGADGAGGDGARGPRVASQGDASSESRA
ncbi:MAG: thiamine-phosphate pyrophosphorylase [Planctomycetota bacterium]